MERLETPTKLRRNTELSSPLPAVQMKLNSDRGSANAVNNWSKPDLGIHPGSIENAQRMRNLARGVPTIPAEELYTIPQLFRPNGSPLPKGKIVPLTTRLSGEPLAGKKRPEPEEPRESNEPIPPPIFKGGRRRKRTKRHRRHRRTRKN